MNSSNFSDFELIENELFEQQTNKTKNKVRKRKWREIESIKEQRRLKRELAEYELYSF